MVYLFDAIFSANPLTMFQTCFFQQQFTTGFQPQLHLLSKVDLLPRRVSQIVEWSGNTRSLEDALNAKAEETKRILV